jgi:hypothetical protein
LLLSEFIRLVGHGDIHINCMLDILLLFFLLLFLFFFVTFGLL